MTDETDSSDEFVVIPRGDFQARSRQFRILFTALILCLCLSAGSIVFTQFQIRGTQKTNGTSVAQTLKVSKETHAILVLVEAATSPSAKSSEQAELQSAINDIDCNSRQELQGLIDILVNDGTLKPSEISLTTNCGGTK